MQFYLYISFLVFLFTYRYPPFASMLAIISFIYALLLKIRSGQAKFTKTELVSILAMVIYVSTIPSMGADWRELLFFIQFCFMLWIFRDASLSVDRFLKFVNLTYVLFVFLSYLVYFHIILPGFRPTLEGVNQFNETFSGIHVKTLIGFSGSTADIDSYSMLVFLLNLLFLRERKYSFLIMALALANTLWTLRLTPLVMLLSAVLFVVLPTRQNKAKLIALLTILFLVPFAPEILRALDYRNYYAFFIMTHGRYGIWEQYGDMVSRLDLAHILLGMRDTVLPDIRVFGSTIWQNNPHSSYLRIFLSSGLLVYLFFYGVMYGRMKNITDKKTLIIAISILVAALSNVNVFFNSNPIFLFTFLYFTSSVSIQRLRFNLSPVRPLGRNLEVHAT